MNHEVEDYRSQWPKPEPGVLSVMLLYEDLLTGRQGKRMLNRVLGQFDFSDEVIIRSWRLTLLDDQLLRCMAAEMAAESDLVVLSAYGNRSKPPGLNYWLQEWKCSEKPQPCAFALLLHTSQEEEGIQCAWLPQMQKEVQSEGCDFFYTYCDPTPLALNQAMQCLAHERPRIESLVEHQETKPHRHWGLNE